LREVDACLRTLSPHFRLPDLVVDHRNRSLCIEIRTAVQEIDMLASPLKRKRKYLLVSNFDQTLSSPDSGVVLSEMLGISDFRQRVAGLSEIHLVQQGGELAYLLLHDAEYRRVRKEHLIEVGKRVRLTANVELLLRLLQNLEDFHFSFHVLSSAPEEVLQSVLAGIVPENHIHGTQFRYAPDTGEIQSIVRSPAGYGKVAVLEELRSRAGVGHGRLVYVGDGSSDVHVMLHINRLDGLTIGVSEKHLGEIAKRTVLRDDALRVLVPILEDIVGYDPVQIRALFESQGFVLQEWGKTRTDSLTIAASA
jgi:phosphoglycolate phosphatase-like HAD superfamily hydrolase